MNGARVNPARTITRWAFPHYRSSPRGVTHGI
jgi:hypothetical protein